MPRFEIVVHVTVDLDGTTPEAAAATVKRQLRAQTDGAATLHGLAVWRESAGGGPAPLPLPVRQHLASFFAGVAGCAATEEAAFRARVGEIFAHPPSAAASGYEHWAEVVGPAGANGRDTECWEEEGGAIVRNDDLTREQS
jgi:hypothetical protein